MNILVIPASANPSKMARLYMWCLKRYGLYVENDERLEVSISILLITDMMWVNGVLGICAHGLTRRLGFPPTLLCRNDKSVVQNFY